MIVIDVKKENPFQKKKGPTTVYERALRNVARQCGNILRGILSDDPLNPDKERSLSQALNSYSELIGPWALHLCNNILRQVDNQDKFAWRQHTRNMSIALRKEVESTPTGSVVQMLLRQNVDLIKSIPKQAAQRVSGLVQENMMGGKRSSEIAKKIMETESVTKSRATLIARTETSKAALALTQARALSIGAETYIWHTTEDLIVRESHRKMNGKEIRWDSPPVLDKMSGHAGGFPNCRCWAEPLISNLK